MPPSELTFNSLNEKTNKTTRPRMPMIPTTTNKSVATKRALLCPLHYSTSCWSTRGRSAVDVNVKPTKHATAWCARTKPKISKKYKKPSGRSTISPKKGFENLCGVLPDEKDAAVISPSSSSRRTKVMSPLWHATCIGLTPRSFALLAPTPCTSSSSRTFRVEYSPVKTTHGTLFCGQQRRRLQLVRCR